MTSDFDAITYLAWAQLWQVTIVALAVGVIVKLCCRERPRLAYALWMLVVVKSIVPPCWSSPTGIFSWALAVRTTEQSGFGGQPADSSYHQRLTPLPATQNVGSAEHSAKSGWRRIQLAMISIWAAGFLLLVALVLAKQIVCATLIRRASVPVDEQYETALAQLARRLGVKRHVRLIVTSRPIGPAAFGLVRPAILMPAALLAGNSREHVELVFAHELVHIRRGDIVAGKLQLIAQLVWWFHPLLWWVHREARQERERTCDAEVVSGVGCKPARYARALLNIVEQKSRLRPLVAIPGVRALEVTSRRLEFIMRTANAEYRRAPLISRLAFLTGLALLMPGAALPLRADLVGSDEPVNPVEAPAAESAVERVMQTTPRSEDKKTDPRDVKSRWRAQQIVTRRAEANYRQARLTREVAEIAIVEYEEGIFMQDLATINGEIALARSDRQRAEDRLDWAQRMFLKAYVSKATLVSNEMNLKKARFALEQAEAKKKVLIEYTKQKTIKELKSEVEKARSDELAKQASWDRERRKELELGREVNWSRAGRDNAGVR